MDDTDWHFSQRLGRWVELVRSQDNPFGWLDVVDAKLARGEEGFRVKMRLDPNNSRRRIFSKARR